MNLNTISLRALVDKAKRERERERERERFIHSVTSFFSFNYLVHSSEFREPNNNNKENIW
jgi:hypothetical protein